MLTDSESRIRGVIRPGLTTRATLETTPVTGLSHRNDMSLRNSLTVFTKDKDIMSVLSCSSSCHLLRRLVSHE